MKPDEKGRFRQRVGVRATTDGQFVAVRFNFGTDVKPAAYRYAAVQALYEDEIKAGADCWTVAGLELAQQIVRGEAATLPPPQATQIIEGGRVTTLPPDGSDDYAQTVELFRQRYPSAQIRPSDPAKYNDGVNLTNEQIAQRMRELQEELRTLGMLLGTEELSTYPVTGTLHEALDKYADYVCTKLHGISDQTMYQRLSQVKQLKLTHEDRPLALLGLTDCQELFGYWTKRPEQPGTEGERYGRPTCKHRVSGIGLNRPLRIGLKPAI